MKLELRLIDANNTSIDSWGCDLPASESERDEVLGWLDEYVEKGYSYRLVRTDDAGNDLEAVKVSSEDKASKLAKRWNKLAKAAAEE